MKGKRIKNVISLHPFVPCYGIHPDIGEECYVADGGEIAVGIARLVSYVSDTDKSKFLDSLNAYMSFRESFRVEDGGIGVGYCLYDYGKTPPRKLDRIMKIYNPEKNPYTIGCSLAAASVHAVLTEDEEARQRAIQDGWWFVDHCAKEFTGCYVESAIWAHHFLDDEELKAAIAKYFKDNFKPYATNLEARWWAGGGGRSVLGIDGMVYYLHAIEDDPKMRAAQEVLTYYLCAPDSPTSVHRVMACEGLNHDQWRYLSYAFVALVDVVQPMLTLGDVLYPRLPI